jgi:hypothetical protein
MMHAIHSTKILQHCTLNASIQQIAFGSRNSSKVTLEGKSSSKKGSQVDNTIPKFKIWMTINSIVNVVKKHCQGFHI